MNMNAPPQQCEALQTNVCIVTLYDMIGGEMEGCTPTELERILSHKRKMMPTRDLLIITGKESPWTLVDRTTEAYCSKEHVLGIGNVPLEELEHEMNLQGYTTRIQRAKTVRMAKMGIYAELGKVFAEAY